MVTLQGFKSVPSLVTSGVPQGSHLGPLFFILFINDLPKKLKCNSLLYADDLKIFKKISSDADCLDIQNDISTLNNWCISNKMCLNISKCFVVKFSNLAKSRDYTYKINNTVLKTEETVKDLGVILDKKLTFKFHYEKLISSCNQTLGFILRVCKEFKNPYTYITLFNCLVRSKLEYASIIWNPFYMVHINLLERIQRKFLRILSFRFGLKYKLRSYESRLFHFGLDSLKNRRCSTDILTLHKIIHGSLHTSLLSEIYINFVTKAPRAGRVYKTFHIKTRRTNRDSNSPIARICRQYNELTIREPNLDIFVSNKTTLRSLIYSSFH